MRAVTENAPSKLILLGEHAVVYGHPAIAVPLRRPCAEAEVTEADEDAPAAVELEDFGLQWSVGEEIQAEELRPFAHIVNGACESGDIPAKGWKLAIRSAVPIGCGLGSGAAVSAAALKAVYRYFGAAITPQALSDSVYETEKMHHGTPSGIDNAVIAMGRPILFRKGKGMEFLSVPETPIYLVAGYTGTSHKTAEVVADVARARAADRKKYDALFDEIGELTLQGADAFQKGALEDLGECMSRNQRLLEKVGVSSPGLENLVRAAERMGALGAKLCGAGRGGCMVALVEDRARAGVLEEILESAGAAMAVTAKILDRSAEKCG